MRTANKHAAPGPDWVTTELSENGREISTQGLLTILMHLRMEKRKWNLHKKTGQSKLSPGKIILLPITIYHDRIIWKNNSRGSNQHIRTDQFI